MSVIDLRLGKWQQALEGVTCNALICDPPYSARTHAAATTRNDGVSADGLTPDYAPWGRDEVYELVRSWSPRCSGWIVALTDDGLIEHWRAAYRDVGRFDFAPVPCVIRGMSCRMQGDGPSSWAIYAMVGRPRTTAFVGGWTNPGGYEGTADELLQPDPDDLAVAADAAREGRWEDVRALIAPWMAYLGDVPERAYVGGTEHQGRAGGSARGKGRGKPRWLEHALVRDYSRPGDVVCDPLAGFGGALAAAVGLGRKAVGSEMDAAAYAEARRRLARPIQMDMLSGGAM